jgi:hypothetical protein
MAKKLYSNPNESGKYSILYATNYSKGNQIENPMRLVVIKYERNSEFALRWQDRSGATYGGYSYQTKEQAHNAFLRKYLDHNQAYRKGNPSHLPGLNERI